MKKTLSVIFFIISGFIFTTRFTCALKSTDVNNDGKVDAADIRLVISSWLDTSNNPSDIDENGKVNSRDLAYEISDFGKATTSPTPTATPSTTRLDLYGVKFGSSNDFQELASLGVMNPVTVVSSNSAADSVIAAAREIRKTSPKFKPILWQYPEGWSCDGINSTGTAFVGYLNSKNYWDDILAIYGLHEPLGSIACGSLGQVVSIHTQIRQLSGGKAKLFGKMYSDTSYKGMGYQDGICDYCGVMYHPYRATNPPQFRKEQMLIDLERDLNIFKSVPSGITLNKFTPYLCTIEWSNSGAYGTGLYMPSPSEMLDGGSSIVNYVSSKGYHIDGFIWYTWGNNSGWIGLDEYNGDGQRAGRMNVIEVVGGLR